MTPTTPRDTYHGILTCEARQIRGHYATCLLSGAACFVPAAQQWLDTVVAQNPERCPTQNGPGGDVWQLVFALLYVRGPRFPKEQEGRREVGPDSALRSFRTHFHLPACSLWLLVFYPKPSGTALLVPMSKPCISGL